MSSGVAKGKVGLNETRVEAVAVAVVVGIRTMHGHGLREGQRHQHHDRRRHGRRAPACVHARVAGVHGQSVPVLHPCCDHL